MKQDNGWQFTKSLEIIKCREGNKEFMKERRARRPFGRTVLICEYPIEAEAAAEAERRRNYRRKHGLTLCADGLRRLIIKEEAAMADRYKICPHCGAHLDFGERCDCEAAADSSGNAEPKTKERVNGNDRN